MSGLKSFILFNEKFEELEKSGFAQNWIGEDLKYNYDFINDELEQEIPTDDEIKSFILTLRFFIQDNEPSSLRNLEKKYEEKNIPDEIALNFKNIKSYLNQLLESKTWFQIDGQPITRRDIFENYIYGFYAHSNDEKRIEVKRWQRHKFLGSQQRYLFIKILFDVYFLLKKINDVNKRALNHIQAS